MAEITIKQAFEISQANRKNLTDADVLITDKVLQEQARAAAFKEVAEEWLCKKTIMWVSSKEIQVLLQGQRPEEKPEKKEVVYGGHLCTAQQQEQPTRDGLK